MYDHERSLVQKMAGKPFALIGVNTDQDLETIRKTIKEQGINWRSFYDGEYGPIVEHYEIESFPTVFLIDHEGVIRHAFPPENLARLDEKIQSLLDKVK